MAIPRSLSKCHSGLTCVLTYWHTLTGLTHLKWPIAHASAAKHQNWCHRQ